VADSPAVQDGLAHDFPDGIGRKDLANAEGAGHRASVLSLLVLALVLAVALSGLLGGGPMPRKTADSARATLTYVGPRFIRNGMFFEAYAVVRAKQPIDKLVVAINESLVHDMTMNSMVPQATDETFEDGSFRFSYGSLDAGQTFTVKFDFEINPAMLAGTAGRIAVFDDHDPLVELPVIITVYP
jgi:hypothetical protein